MQKRRLVRLVLVLAMAAGLSACNNGATAGDGITSPPSSSPQ